MFWHRIRNSCGLSYRVSQNRTSIVTDFRLMV
jgi:hypothetical protein